jgi:tungstate transport system ATP-binding protein
MARPAPDAAAVVALRGVAVDRGARTVLEVPALAVAPGEVLGVMGPNGAGKSTLLRVLGLLEAPTRGTVAFRGELVPASRALAVRRRMASVFQEPLLADARVLDNVAMGLRFRGVPRAEVARRVPPWLERFGIAALAGRAARSLSGGEAQRVALARALVLEPELLLLDEPFAALDQPTREALIQDLRSILRAEHTTAVLVTHHRGEALALGDRLAVLIGGRLLQTGAPREVLRAPADEAVARFMGMETVIPGRVLGREAGTTRVETAGGVLGVSAAAPVGAAVCLCLRPEDVVLTDVDAAATPGHNALAGKVVRAVAAPTHVRVVLDCGTPVVALVTHRAALALPLEPGAALRAEFSPDAVHLLPAA